MRVTVVLVTVAVALAQARPQFGPAGFDYTTLTTTHRPFIPVLSRSEVRDETGQLALSYKTGDGTILDQRAVLKPSADGKRKVLVQEGTYSYTSPDGTPIQVSYIADETGFHAVGNHILTGDVPATVPVHAPVVHMPPAPVPVVPQIPIVRTPVVPVQSAPAPPPYRHDEPYVPYRHDEPYVPYRHDEPYVPYRHNEPYVITPPAAPITHVTDTSLPQGFFRIF